MSILLLVEIDQDVIDHYIPDPCQCEGCEAIYEYGQKAISDKDTLPNYDRTKSRLKLTGIIYRDYGFTPAENVLMYIYHANETGIYEKLATETGWGRRHGHIRGWIRTNHDGRYTFYTSLPGHYSNRSEPAHIHVVIKEPGFTEYYIDDFLFEGDPELSIEVRSKLENRGGSGINEPRVIDGLLTIERDIILGLNIPCRG